jgi:hypothetical protein
MKQDTDIKIAIEIGMATRVSATKIAFVAMFVAEAESDIFLRQWPTVVT